MTRAKLFRNGQSQAVRLPKELAMPGRDVFARRVGNAVLLVPTEDPWGGFEASLDAFSADFLEDREQPMLDERPTL